VIGRDAVAGAEAPQALIKMDLIVTKREAIWSSSSCGKDDLTNIFGWTVQAVLAALAFTCLICKSGCFLKITKISHFINLLKKVILRNPQIDNT
jgi:hypothetical protein